MVHGWSFAQNEIFSDITSSSHLQFDYTFGDDTYNNIIESSGSGVSIIDYNGDGWMDIYLLNGTYLPGISDPSGIKYQHSSNRLFHNNGDGTFLEKSRSAGLDDKHWSMEAAIFDYDADGDQDVYLLNYGPNVLLENRGNGTFRDITGKVGLEGPTELNGFTKWSVSAVFWDYNLDGLMDVSVGNFLAFDPSYVSPATPDIMPHPSEYAGQASLLYEQQKDGTFQDRSHELGLYYPQSKCMGITILDFDDDGDLDIFQGNDHQANFMFRNDGQGQFTDVAQQSGLAVNDEGQVTGSMHGTPGDVDGDGRIDLLVTDLKYGALYRNLGSGIYEDITRASGVAYYFNAKGQWGALLIDFDNDGDLDIFTANGTAEELIKQKPLLLINDGQGRFTSQPGKSGSYFQSLRSGRGCASIDFDNDGDLDIVVSHVDDKRSAALLQNNLENSHHWIGITLKSSKNPGSTVSAKVSVNTRDKTFVAINQAAASYLSYNDPRIHFGLGDAQTIDKITVRWTGGATEEFYNIVPDQYITLVEGKGKIIN